MDSRQQFEEWAISSAWLGLGEESQVHMDADGKGYNEIEVHTAWLAWQASRAAIVIEMPTTCASDDPYQIKREIIDELRDNGIRTK